MISIIQTLSQRSFNSRTPGGVRLLVADKSNTFFRFNSRTPGGVRRLILCVTRSVTEFQFTHPGRGATYRRQDYEASKPVSIHAPREGCDRMERVETS